MVDERADSDGSVLRRLDVGVLEVQARPRIDHARRLRQPGRHQVLTCADSSLLDGDFEERQGQLLGRTAMESFFRTLKIERVYRVRYPTRADARLDIVDSIERFHNHALHSSIDSRTPVAEECRLNAA